MNRKIFTGVAVTALAFIATGFVVAMSEDEPVDVISAVTGCGAIASADWQECLYQCNVEYVQCNMGCLPLPDDCRETPPGPECELYTACKNACWDEFRNCRLFC